MYIELFRPALKTGSLSAMDINTSKSTETGYVAFFSTTKNFGFIETMEEESIYFHKTQCEKGYRNIYSGDKVEFEYDENEGRACANNVQFRGNATLEGLRADFEKGTVLQGFIKRIEDKYYIKDSDTHIFIKLAVSPYEIDIEDVYENSINKKREYKIIVMTERNGMRAALVGRRLHPETDNLISKRVYNAEVIADVNGGYQIKLETHDIKGFVRYNAFLKGTAPLAVGSFVEVQWQSVNLDYGTIVFELVNAVYKRRTAAELASRRADNLSRISPGHVDKCKVKSVVHFGAFVTFDLYGDGLLHIEKFLAHDASAYTPAKKKVLGKLLAELLPIYTELIVVITEIDGARCSVDLDMTVPANVIIKELFSERKRQFLGA